MGDVTSSPLVVRFGALGDMVLLTPLLRMLHRRYGQPCRVIGSGVWLESIYLGSPDVSEVFVLRSRKRPYWLDRSQRQLVRRLRTDPVAGPVYVCDDYETRKIHWLLDRANIKSGHCVYANPNCLLGEDEHWIDRWSRFGQMTPPDFGPFVHSALAQDFIHAPTLYVRDIDRIDLQRWLHQSSLDDSPIVLLQPGNKRTLKHGRAGSRGDDKSWPIEHWAALARELLASNSRSKVVLCGIAAEQPFLREIAHACRSKRVVASGRGWSLRRLMALCERAVGMISIDTGPAHVAAALGCPLVVMYGAARPAQWMPRSSSHSPVIALGGRPRSTRVADISLKEVLTAWQSLSSLSAKP